MRTAEAKAKCLITEVEQQFLAIKKRHTDELTTTEMKRQEYERLWHNAEHSEPRNRWNGGPKIEVSKSRWNGRHLLGDRNIVNKITHNGIAIPTSNDFFGCDTTYGQRKMCSFVYKRQGHGIVKSIA